MILCPAFGLLTSHCWTLLLIRTLRALKYLLITNANLAEIRPGQGGNLGRVRACVRACVHVCEQQTEDVQSCCTVL